MRGWLKRWPAQISLIKSDLIFSQAMSDASIDLGSSTFLQRLPHVSWRHFRQFTCSWAYYGLNMGQVCTAALLCAAPQRGGLSSRVQTFHPPTGSVTPKSSGSLCMFVTSLQYGGRKRLGGGGGARFILQKRKTKAPQKAQRDGEEMSNARRLLNRRPGEGGREREMRVGVRESGKECI